MEILLILLLVFANGVFSMAEMAVLSARKARLRQRADDGSRGAAVALELAENPNDFLSTVQVGITVIGTLAGAFGGATVADNLAAWLRQFPALAEYSESIAIGVVVAVISYLSLILGELVPKALALSHAEKIASALAPIMRWLSRLGSPIVRFLTFSTELVLKAIPLKKSQEAPVTEEEIHHLIAQGTEHGTFHAAEQEMVEGVFVLGDRRVVELMRPRNKVTWLDVEDPWEVNEAKIRESSFSRFLVAEGDLDRLIGVIHVKDLLVACRQNSPVDLRALARKPLFVPEVTPALTLLEMFQKSGDELAVVVDEHGGIEGIITLMDLVEAVIGDLRQPGDTRPQIIRREDGSWLADGSLPASDVADALKLRELPGEEDEDFTTLGGFVLAHLKKIPSAGNYFIADGWRFEVVDMDRNRVDKVLIQKLSEE